LAITTITAVKAAVRAAVGFIGLVITIIASGVVIATNKISTSSLSIAIIV